MLFLFVLWQFRGDMHVLKSAKILILMSKELDRLRGLTEKSFYLKEKSLGSTSTILKIP